MTDSPQRPPLTFDAIDDVLEALRARGYRVTQACRVVLDALFAADGPVSAQFIADRRDAGGVPLELSSVYRNLERLEEIGVVNHVHLGHGPGLYLLVGAGEKEFLVCERCGRVTSLDPGELDAIRAEIRRRFGYEARFGHFPIIGLCERCAEAGDRATPGHDAGHDHEHSHGDYVHSHPHPGGHDHHHQG